MPGVPTSLSSPSRRKCPPRNGACGRPSGPTATPHPTVLLRPRLRGQDSVLTQAPAAAPSPQTQGRLLEGGDCPRQLGWASPPAGPPKTHFRPRCMREQQTQRQHTNSAYMVASRFGSSSSKKKRKSSLALMLSPHRGLGKMGDNQINLLNLPQK